MGSRLSYRPVAKLKSRESAGGEVFHRRAQTARSVRNAGRQKAHLHARQRAAEHQIIEATQVADPEKLSLLLAQGLAERKIEAIEYQRSEAIRVVSLGHADRGERIRVFPFIERVQLEAPGANRPPRRLRVARVPRKYVLQPLLFQHRERLAQTEEQVRRGRVREVAALVRLEHGLPVPVGVCELRLL